MNISIEVTGDLLQYLDEKVKEGLYKSRSEVVRTAIREMIQHDIQEQLKAKGLRPKDIPKLRDEVAGELLDKAYKDTSS